VRLANSSSLLSSAPVRSRIRWRRLLLGAVALLGVGVLTASALIAGRPVKVTQRNNALANRDIILCLDVSTSMVTTDSQILDTFSELLDTFDGERVGLVVWNSTAQTMVPLTDDYELLRDQLKEIADVLDFTPSRGNPALGKHYETFPGWNTDISGIRSYEELPENARKYLERMAEITGIALGIVSVGPSREQTIVLAEDLF